MSRNVILRMEADERYLRHRLDRIHTELMAAGHPLVGYDEIRVNENQEAIIPFDIYFEDVEEGCESGVRPMLRSWLTIGPVLKCLTQGDPHEGCPVLEEMSFSDDSLVLEMIGFKVILRLGNHPKAILEITDSLSRGCPYYFPDNPPKEPIGMTGGDPSGLTEAALLTEKTILRMEADARYIRHRFDSMAVELISVDHPLTAFDEDIRLDENRNAVIPFDMYFEGYEEDRSTHARPMLRAWLTVGPVDEMIVKGSLKDAPPLLQDMKIKSNNLTLELLDAKVILRLGEHPRAVLEITDRISRYKIRKGLWYHFVNDPGEKC